MTYSYASFIGLIMTTAAQIKLTLLNKSPSPVESAPMRILLMSVGNLVAQNVLDCLARHDRRYFLIGANSAPEAPGNFRCDVAYVVPRADAGPACLEAYRTILAAERPQLIIPCRDEDLPLLAALRAEIGGPNNNGPNNEIQSNDGPVCLCGDQKAAALFADKLAVHLFALSHGLPFAPTAHDAASATALAAAHGFPLIAKPRRGGFGSRGVALLRNAADLNRAAAMGGYVFQPFLTPPGAWADILRPLEIGVPLHFAVPVPDQYTGQAFIAPDGATVGVFCSLVAMDAGKVAVSRRIDCPSFSALTRAFAAAAAAEGHRGPLNIQCRRAENGDYIPIELNGRFSGSTSARALQGYDEVDIAVRFAAGLPLPPPQTGPFPVVVKTPTDAVIPCADFDALSRAGYWRRPSAD